MEFGRLSRHDHQADLNPSGVVSCGTPEYNDSGDGSHVLS